MILNGSSVPMSLANRNRVTNLFESSYSRLKISFTGPVTDTVTVGVMVIPSVACDLVLIVNKTSRRRYSRLAAIRTFLPCIVALPCMVAPLPVH